MIKFLSQFFASKQQMVARINQAEIDLGKAAAQNLSMLARNADLANEVGDLSDKLTLALRINLRQAETIRDLKEGTQIEQ